MVIFHNLEYISIMINLAKIIAVIALVGAVLFGLNSCKNDLIEQGRAEVRADWERAELVALKAHADEIERLTIANKEVQDAYNQTADELADLLTTRSRSAGLREQERQAIIKSTRNATAQSLRDYATRAERDIEQVENDAEQLGQDAVRASAAAHALQSTLLTREAIDKQRKELR